MDGKDVVGRARTGQGKTLAFVLPILECLARNAPAGTRPAHGRSASVIVLAPTRELANQVHADFSKYGACLGLATVCVYGGAPMASQEAALRRGVDVVVGTPGRVRDFLERGTLGLGALRFRVLDEADEMLNMGFVDDVEFILSNGKPPGSEAAAGAPIIQTLLFSATLPSWVADVARRFLRADRETVDLVGSSTLKAAESVTHLLCHCAWQERTALIADTIRARAPAIVSDDGAATASRVIVFCETKKDTQEVAETLQAALPSHGARALHGDIPQATREKTLADFRSGRFAVLVATDVAARGLDINNIVLVIQAEPPRDPETYIHRSGRTGRAGALGVSVTFCTQRHAESVPHIERKAGIKFSRVGAPQQADLAAAAAIAAAAAVRAVAPEAAALFRQAASELLAQDEVTAEDVLAAALAKIAGHTTVVSRSLLSSHSGVVTLLFTAPTTVHSPSYVWSYLRARITDAVALDEVKRMSLLADGTGAVFDVPAEKQSLFCECTSKGPAQPACTITVARELPQLAQREAMQSPGGFAPGRGGYGGGGYRGGYGGGRAGGRGGGRTSFGRGAGGARGGAGRWR
jgi:ATP-dependent RNA helicase DDX21